MSEIEAAGWRVGNIDAAVVAETPKLSPHLPAIRARMAGILHCPEDCVSVKGKTNEGMDDVGARVGICVHAVALLVR